MCRLRIYINLGVECLAEGRGQNASACAAGRHKISEKSLSA